MNSRNSSKMNEPHTHPRVLVGIPSGQNWDAKFGMSLMGLIAGTANPPPPFEFIDLGLHNAKGSILPQLRQNIVKGALQKEATHVLFIDSDMTFPPDVVTRLLAHNLPVVACNCVTKTLPASPTARLFEEGNPAGRLVYQHEWNESDGPLKEVWRVGTGIMMIDMSVFDHLKPPYFPIKYSDLNEDFVGEDWGFCELLQEVEIPIYVDMDLSFEIGHRGSLEYTHQYVEVKGD